MLSSDAASLAAHPERLEQAYLGAVLGEDDETVGYGSPQERGDTGPAPDQGDSA